MSWALTVFRAFGVAVKVHAFFPVIALGFFLRQYTDPLNTVWWVDIFLLTVVLLFLVTLLHEFGHCFAARALGGEANEILMWPLGGLAFVELPPRPRPHFWTAAAGPGTNAAICLACAGALAAGGFLPNLAPLANPYVAEIKNYRDGRLYTSEYGAPNWANSRDIQALLEKNPEAREALERSRAERAVAPAWATWSQRLFWLSWIVMLFNLLPAYPLDGGQMLYAVIWGRSGQRRATLVSGYSGYAVAALFLMAALAANESLFVALALTMFYASYLKLGSLDADDGPFGYDFSAGYTSLERDDEAPVRPRKKGGVFKRWLQARAARRFQREAEERNREDERMDELLAKIARQGKETLSDEERRFMERVSARYRNRS